MKRIAIIPARSGSKGLKDKNIKEINGKPLIAYTIEAALKSGLFDVVHVSTDSERYLDIAKEYGADEPFLRNSETSGDCASSWDVVKEVINKYKNRGYAFEQCALLQPTSPLRDYLDIKNAFELFEKRNANSVVSVKAVDHPTEWCFTLDDAYSMEDFANNPSRNCRRQELKLKYIENGAIYILKTSLLKENNFDIYSDKCYAYIMSRLNSIDIDESIDFEIASILMDKKVNN